MNDAATKFPVAILAGGLATRLRPITETVPKSLVEVAGRPFLEHQLELLRGQGLTDIVLCVGHLGEQIRDRFGDGREWGVRLDYSFDGPRLLGTGGALRKALPFLAESFYVLYGDSYLPIDYRAAGSAYVVSGKEGLMTVFKNEGRWDQSNVWFENERIVAYDKARPRPEMQHIDYGLSILSASVIANLAQDAVVDLAEVLRNLVARDQLAGYETDCRFYEIGSPGGLAELDARLRQAGRDSSIP